MNSVAQLVTVLTTLLSIALLLLVVFRLWPALRLDTFRQNMFALRDELFDYAADGNISFTDPAYALLRKSMNGFIRYGHNLSFFRISITMLNWKICNRQPTANWSDSWNAAVAKVEDADVRQKLRDFHGKSLDLVASRVVLGSPFLIFALLVVASTLVIEQRWRSMRQSFESVMTRFIEPRLLEEEASNA